MYKLSFDEAEVVILADGSYPKGEVAKSLLDNAPKVVCCDGAANLFVANGGIPYAIVGDCDSINDSVRTKFADIVHVSHEQETNDLSKAIRFCSKEGFKNILILGASGKREDHLIANISILAKDYVDINLCMVTNYGVFNAIEYDSVFESYIGQPVSLFTLNPNTTIQVENLQYKIPESKLQSWWSGTLNKAIADNFTVRVNDKCLVYRIF